MAKKIKLQSASGMHDILPEDQGYYKRIYEVVSGMAEFYGFQKIDTPILEDAELFSKSIGETSDVVSKEMYTLKTKGGDSLGLRPEWTTPIVRSYIEHGMQVLPQPLKLWYFGPCYRYERPQADRYRQFWQFGFEIFGESNPVIDAQIIQIQYNILKELKLKDISVEVNSIGDSNCRPYYKKLLGNYLKSRESSLCADCKKRFRENVLRVLDCKDEKCQPIKTEAPQILDHLCDECHSHFKEVLEFLDEIEVPYTLNPYLVRGLDYYTKTVFEMFQESEETGKKALAGGGRYDKLVKLLGGRDTFACGVAAGVERIVSLMKAQGIEVSKEKETQVFLAQLGSLAKRKSLKLLEEFRKSRIKVGESFGRDSLKVQLNRANKLGAKYTLIIGQKEALEDVAIVRNMKNGKQDIVKMDKVVADLKKKL
ncbi:histidine--tRNA ligase [Patescibacteria group bacterium]|nr:histidine--tRNA ligase [Patescibacteria group bacterium]